MTNSRRNFCKNAFCFGLGLSVVPFISTANSPDLVIGNSLNLVKNATSVLKINGKINTANLNPVPNATIEIWHTNSENNPSNFEYMGELSTDSNGCYSLLTDLPGKHFDNGYFRMRRLFLKIVNKEREAFSTALYIGENGEPFVDSKHFQNTAMKPKDVPTLKSENNNLSTIEFNIFLDF